MNIRVALYEPSGRGGVCHYTHALAEGLSRVGADVTLLTTDDDELAGLERGYRVVYLFSRSWLSRVRSFMVRRARRRTDSPAAVAAAPGRGRSPVGALRRLRLRLLHLRALAFLLWRRADVVHFQWFADRREDCRFVRRLRRFGIVSVYTAHDVEPHLTASDADRSELATFYAAVDRVIVHSESNRRELLEAYPVDAGKVTVIPHGSYDFLCAGQPSREAARWRLRIPADRRVILFFGLIKRYKGLEYLLDAFESIRRTDPRAFLLVVGDVFAADAAGAAEYRRRLAALEGREDVRCIVAYVPVEDVSLYFAASDVVVLPYVRTYQSGVLLAAYAAGRPVVVTDTGGLAEVVEPGQTGSVVPPRDVAALAAAIGRILDDEPRRQEMGERARQLATDLYGWDAIAERTIALYRSAVSGRRHGVEGRVAACL